MEHFGKILHVEGVKHGINYVVALRRLIWPDSFAIILFSLLFPLFLLHVFTNLIVTLS